ncbi:pheromone processing endoprotease [Mortierella sp. AM989]|nr:pheromone processing endoprotease [Mortierella sp. AM989]
MGDLLGLRFEFRVGMLPNYFLYSSPKPAFIDNSTLNTSDSKIGQGSKPRSKQSTHSKRSFLVSDTRSLNGQPEVEVEEADDVEPVSLQPKEQDAIVKRFYQLKGQYSGNQGQSKRQKRHDEQAEVAQVMGDIHKQELRQRVKKRAPLPDAHLDLRWDSSSWSLTRSKSIEQSEIEAEEEEMDEEEAAAAETSIAEYNEQISEEEEEEDEGKDEKEVEEETEESQDEKKEYQPVGEEQPDDGVAGSLGFKDPGINGTGVNVAIIDDGLDMDSEDLAPNFFKEGSWDFNDDTALPKPKLIDDKHGTRCAGEIASAKNDLCGVGVAYGAKVAGLRILSGQITDADEAAALNYRFQENHIYSCSWGPTDDGRSLDAPRGVVKDALVNGIKNGRSGKGSIFVFATGNGGSQDDDCNFDGYTNSLYTISIGAIDRAQRHPYYSEACSAQLAVTYSNGGGSAIYTCDVGERRCFEQHGGTSAAAPIAAGIIALALSVRPDLTWRDVQYLLMTTAIPISLNDSDWKETASGRLFNHKFGYGSLDAYRFVEAAKTFKSLRPQTSLHPPAIHVRKVIPRGRKGVSSIFKVTKKDLEARRVQLGTLEHITVTVNIEHERRGDVEVILMSPNKIESRLGVKRRFDNATTGFINWTFMTVKHWEENPIGEWTLTVRDQDNPSYSGKFVSWRIKFWGERSKEIADRTVQPWSGPSAKEQGQVLSETTDTLHEMETEILPRPSADSKVTVNIDTSELKEPQNEGEHEGQPIKDGKPEDSAGTSNGNSVAEENTAQDKTADEIIELVVQTESEEELASIVSHTLYIFFGVLGIAGLVIGFMVKRKSDGHDRGSYAGVRASPLDMNIRDFGNDEEDNIDLLPLEYSSSSASIDNDEEYDNGNISSNNPEIGTNGGNKLEMKELIRSGRTQGDRFEVGSDTDEQDFFVTSNLTKSKETGGIRRATWLAYGTSSPATLEVEEPSK